MQGERFEQVAGRLKSRKVNHALPASSCASGLINDFWYAKEDEEFIEGDQSLLSSCRLRNADFQQNEIYTENDQADSSGFVLIPSGKLLFENSFMPTTAKHS